MEFQFNGMYYSFTNTQLIVAAFVLVVIVAIAIAAYVEHRKTKTRAMRNRFGSEYDREVLKRGSSRQAESKLAERETYVKTLEIRDLGVVERDRFLTEWSTIQSRFVNHPKSAVTEADDLINALLEARGYPHASFEQRAADLSVSYPRVMENYRLAHAVAVRPGKIDATTEELRIAMIQYRAIFDELAQPVKPAEQKSAA
jgi:nucleosome binding factor SPN SPT16 subunit